MSRRLYAAHRIVAAVAFLQLAVWSISGLLFSLIPEDRVRGAQVPRAHEVALSAPSHAISPDVALASVAEMGVRDVHRLELRNTPAGLFYLARARDSVVRLDARTGKPAPVERAEAEASAVRDQPGSPQVKAIEYIEKAPLEYRGKPLPAFRVELLDSAETVIYVDARTGDVTARRTATWRTFDFLYGIHILRYETREGLNHPLLTGAAALAVFTVLSGVVLWCIRLVRWIRARRQIAPAEA